MYIVFLKNLWGLRLVNQGLEIEVVFPFLKYLLMRRFPLYIDA
jgi:hypothetical protein